MTPRQATDVAAAFLIGALFGVGATLLLRADEEDDVEQLLRQLRQLRRVSLHPEPPDHGLRAALHAAKARRR
ncbi:MAG: hypothetical protein ACREL7_13605 [Longimicrobiales bacterium]